MISIIVAVAENFAIGKNNDLLWHIPADLKRFKLITTGHAVIMGKRTFESLPKRPLPNRRNIVLTDTPGETIEGCEIAYSINEVLEKCAQDEEHFVIGGASVYRQFLPYTQKLYLTTVHKPFDGDVWFPEINFQEWVLLTSETFPPDQHNDFSYTNQVFVRRA